MFRWNKAWRWCPSWWWHKPSSAGIVQVAIYVVFFGGHFFVLFIFCVRCVVAALWHMMGVMIMDGSGMRDGDRGKVVNVRTRQSEHVSNLRPNQDAFLGSMLADTSNPGLHLGSRAGW